MVCSARVCGGAECVSGCDALRGSGGVHCAPDLIDFVAGWLACLNGCCEDCARLCCCEDEIVLHVWCLLSCSTVRAVAGCTVRGYCCRGLLVGVVWSSCWLHMWPAWVSRGPCGTGNLTWGCATLGADNAFVCCVWAYLALHPALVAVFVQL